MFKWYCLVVRIVISNLEYSFLLIIFLNPHLVINTYWIELIELLDII